MNFKMLPKMKQLVTHLKYFDQVIWNIIFKNSAHIGGRPKFMENVATEQ